MRKELSPIIRQIRSWIKKEKVMDVIIFGSYVRGKSHPKDLDLCIIINDNDENKSLDLVDSLNKAVKDLGLNAQINILTSSAIVAGNTLAKTLLNEGYSIMKDRSFSRNLGFENKSLFVYTLKHFPASKRVKFHYMLKGRYGSKGMLKEVEGQFIGTGSILVPTEKEDLLRDVFKKWDVKHEIYRILLS